LSVPAYHKAYYEIVIPVKPDQAKYGLVQFHVDKMNEVRKGANC